MRRILLITTALVIMGSTFFQVNWTDTSMTAVTFRAPGVQESINECLDSSREAKLRFDMRLCRWRRTWLDACADERTEIHSVSYDSITESYRVVSDRLGDDSEPVAVGIPSRKEAVLATITAENVPMAFLARDEQELPGHERAYIQARAVFVCKGSVNRTVAQLSQILTLGLVNVVEEDSGWLDFSFNPHRSGGDTQQPERE